MPVSIFQIFQPVCNSSALLSNNKYTCILYLLNEHAQNSALRFLCSNLLLCFNVLLQSTKNLSLLRWCPPWLICLHLVVSAVSSLALVRVALCLDGSISLLTNVLVSTFQPHSRTPLRFILHPAARVIPLQQR